MMDLQGLQVDLADPEENIEKQESFLATVVEIEEQAVIVEAVKGEWGLKDPIRIKKNEVISEEGMPKLEVGDLIQIVYNGDVMETYPAQLGKIFAVYLQNERDSGIKTAEYGYQYANIKLQLPKDWEYEIIPAEQEDGTDIIQNFGICFFPEEETEMKLELLYWVNGIGICGTGVTIEKVNFQNGMTATQYTETIEGTTWVTLVYRDLPGTYALSGSVPKELWEKYKPAVMEILEQAEFGTGKE